MCISRVLLAGIATFALASFSLPAAAAEVHCKCANGARLTAEGSSCAQLCLDRQAVPGATGADERGCYFHGELLACPRVEALAKHVLLTPARGPALTLPRYTRRSGARDVYATGADADLSIAVRR